MAAYQTIAEVAEAEIVEKKSRFIGRIAPVADEEEALAFIAEVKAAHRMARHNVYAYVLRGGRIRYTDDGEPAKTAGMPTLEAIQHAGLEDVAVVVTRYFGGILLGAGGLTRAYTRGAKDALDAAGVCRVSLWTLWDVPCTYPLLERVKMDIAACGGVVRDTVYGAEVTLRAAFPAGGAESFVPRLTELSAGALEMAAAGEEYLPGPREE
ncbi:YigZ family protein [uncultured Oscillibacter sp.]|uniref:IMPACT family protein n=1 Tax=uncultured Oscillibacter sp. TaxID=876091 RepID=UPI00260D4E9D|nr:YigZ family protein [uncultured Oscillibacter sp.]